MGDAPKVACGLANLGNTCYLNATLQVLVHVPPLVRFVLQQPPAVPSGDRPATEKEVQAAEDAELYAAARRVFALTWAHAGRSMVVSPGELVGALRPPLARHGIANVRDQSDAHELYCILADAMCSGAPDRRAMADVLCGSTQQLVRCETCGATSTQVTPFTTLDIDLGADPREGTPATVGELLRRSFAPERVAPWTCDACGRARSAAKITRLWALPAALIVCIKRTVGAGAWDVSRRPVLPEETLSRSLLARLAAPGSPAASGIDRQRGVRYRLSGVVCHFGNQGGGHYTALVRHPEAQEAGDSGSWLAYDDESVHRVGALPEGAHASCYMLAYARL